MKTINYILKTLVYLIHLPWLFIDIFIIPYSLSISLDYTVIELIILDVLYIYLIYLFYENTSCNKKNDYKIIIVVIISISIAVILYTSMNYSVLSISFFLCYFLPYIILIISMQFNKLCMKKFKKTIH